MRILGFCVLFCLAATPTKALAGFVIHPADDIYADSARYYLNYFEKRISQVIGSELDTTVDLYLASTEKEFLQDTGVTPPDWGAGIALLDQAKIVIKSPKYMRIGKSFGELIGHELAHIMIHRAAKGRWLPRWLHEGFAMYISGEWHIGQDILVARAAWTGNLIPLHQLENLSTFKGVQANLAYTESYLAASNLLRQNDPYVLPDLLDMYRRNADFYLSWKSVMGQDYVNWITTWQARTSRQYHFFFFLVDSELFWIILALVFILLFVAKKAQNARTRKRWKREEMINPPDDSYKQYFDGYYDEENQV